MDGGCGQRDKAEEVKREVRRGAARRRGTLSIDVLEPIPTERPNDDSEILDGLDRHGGLEEWAPIRTEATPDPRAGFISTSTRSSAEPILSNAHAGLWNGLPKFVSNSSGGKLGDTELDRRFMMLYYDHFFPFLFPFYRPLLLEGGRTWIMELVVGDQVMWHTTLCLSTYFVSVALDGTASGHTICKKLAWEKLLKQMNVTFVMLQRNLQEVGSTNTHDLVIKSSRIMGSIIQLQRFEISVGNFENCQKHLGAAITLFREVFRASESGVEGNDLTTLYSVLGRMGRPLWTIASQPSGTWNSDQAAFRFYSALLVVDDIIASTCVGQPPRLLDFHTRLLTNRGCSDERTPLSLEEFIGCENWVMLQMSEIAVLDAWKKLMKQDGKLDTMELVARASSIKQALLENLTRLDAAANTPVASPLGLFVLYNDQLPAIPGGCATFVTRVWAHAALLYLSVVVSGWQPGSAGIRENVVRTLALLEQMPAPELLRTMVWPFCMAGCLAAREEEYRFRAMADALVPRRLFGAARKALEIMEKVWQCRDEMAVDADFAACVRSLGYTSLLV